MAKLTAEQIVKRKGEMRIARLRGATNVQIAEEFGVSLATVKRTWAEGRAQDNSIGENPLDVVVEVIDALRMNRRAMHEVFDNAAGEEYELKDGEGKVIGVQRTEGNYAAQVGAMRLIMEFQLKELQFRIAMGTMPKTLNQIQVILDMRRLFEGFEKIMVEYGASDEMLADLHALLPKVDEDELPVIEAKKS
jgi:hypothetical protein